VPLAAQRTIASVTARCSTTGQTYLLVFERIGKGAWVLTRTCPSSTTGNMADNGSQIRLAEIAWDRSEADPCPYCSHRALIQCSSCSQISCHSGAEKGEIVKCASCGAAGRIEDHIRKLEGKQQL
jgi:hypothetical protein